MMLNRWCFIFVLSLMLVLTIAAQAQEPYSAEIPTNLGYLTTYNIPELRFDPVWYAATHSGLSGNSRLCVCNHGYLVTYDIFRLPDDPFWHEVLAEFVITDASQGV
jgi:hypothetical protein